MSWKEPDIYTLKASSRVKDILRKSYYFGEIGSLREANWGERATVLANYLLPYALFVFIGTFYSFFWGMNSLVRILFFILLSIVFVYSIYRYYYDGFKKFKEYWIKFDENEEVITYVTREGERWEVTDIPYESVEEVRYSGTTNGRIILKAPHTEIKSYRVNKKNPFSVTEIWDRFAKIDAPMNDWPFELRCMKCNRIFGHHQGTALCPFDENEILIDDSIKGRIDPESVDMEDLKRV